ncbi:MAG TPA: sugar transferase [Bacteroidota bacterium]|nr:sugar transferase [Bacteroidota bacterium]
MSHRTERIITVVTDFIGLNLAYLIFYWIRVRSGWIYYTIEPELWRPMTAVYCYWLLWFSFFGLYQYWYAQSRLDELLTLFRTSLLGGLVLFFVIFVDDTAVESRTSSRILIGLYWVFMFTTVASGRLAVRAIQKRLLIGGVGARNTLIVGWSEKAFQLCDMVLSYPALGYNVVGFARPTKRREGKGPATTGKYRDVPVLGYVGELPKLIHKHRIQEVLIGLDSTEHDRLMEVMRFCNGHDVGMKIVPDLYDIVSGQARISSLYGSPLMDVRPQILKPWEAAMKRSLDTLVSLAILLVGLPLWLVIAAAIKLDSPGRVFYIQERLGRNGKVFGIFKFRSMRANAEQQSGPVWAGRNDPRVTRMGRLLRRLHLDEVPQFINVLLGHMSLVGPRPERPYFVEKLAKQIPLYRHRLRVRPGITGWAQVKHKYDENLDDVKAKVKYDLFYIENLSWRLDLKILFNTLYVMLMGRGHT